MQHVKRSDQFHQLHPPYNFFLKGNLQHHCDDKRNTEVDAYRIKFENSPMVAACEGGYIDIVEYLVENGYNTLTADRYSGHLL
jgi:hypothetical protein